MPRTVVDAEMLSRHAGQQRADGEEDAVDRGVADQPASGLGAVAEDHELADEAASAPGPRNTMPSTNAGWVATTIVPVARLDLVAVGDQRQTRRRGR